jgi:tetratricopeptide (TPR) repeat protein
MLDTSSLKYRAFVSYSHADTRLACWLHASLENFKIDKDLVGCSTPMGPIPQNLRPVFRDRDDFEAGSTLKEQTIAALDEAAALVVLCSPASAKSGPVNEEIRLFRWRHPDRPVIPIILDGKPGDPENECFPPALRHTLTAAGEVTDQGLDLIAADIRESADGRQLALAKVVARLIGRSPDEVFRRAERERRRQGRVRAWTASAILALLAAGGFFYWQSYERQQTISEVQALVNKYSFVGSAQASDSVAKENLAAAIQAIADGAATDPRYAKALAFLKAGQPGEAASLLQMVAEDEAARGQRINKQAAQKYRQLGAIAGLGNPKAAREAYARALELDPDDSESLYWAGFLGLQAGDLALAERSLFRLLDISTKTSSNTGLYRAHLRLGEIALAKGDVAGAILHEQQALAIAEEAAAAEPANLDWQRDRSISLEKIGDIEQARGRLSAAFEDFTAVVGIREALAKADRQNPEWQRILAIAYSKIGAAQQAQGNVAAALESYSASLAIRDRLANSDPGNAGFQRDLSIAYDKIGSVLVSQRKFSDALEKYRAALGIRERLAMSDANNSGWQRDVSVSLETIGDVMRAQRDLTSALDNYRRSFAIRDRLAKANPENAGWQRDLSVSYNKIGDVLRVQGKFPEALESFKASFAIRDRIGKLDPGNVEWQVDLALSLVRLGQIYSALGEKAEALNKFTTAREILAPLARTAGNKTWLDYIQSIDEDVAALK